MTANRAASIAPGLIVAAAVGGAVAAQALRPGAVVMVPGAPWNWLLPAIPALAIVAWRWARPDHPALRCIGSVPWALAALGALALVCLPLAVWPAGTAAPAWLAASGYGDATRSLPFAVTWGVLVMSLAAVTGLRLARRERTLAWWRSVLIHAGLLIAAAGAVAAAGTLVRGRGILQEGGPPASELHGELGVIGPAPAPVALADFRLDNFAPTLAIAAQQPDGAWSVRAGEVLLGPGGGDAIDGWTVRVEEWLPSAAVVGGVPRPYHEQGAGPAARVAASGPGGAQVAGWIHAPTAFGERLFLILPDHRALMMADPRPRRFAADLLVDGAQREIAVNQPLHHAGWTWYLTSYDEKLGGASTTAVIEVVRDPALPGVYLGLILLSAGMLLSFGETLRRTPIEASP